MMEVMSVTAGAVSRQSNHHHQQSSFLQAGSPFQPTNQQCQSTEGNY